MLFANLSIDLSWELGTNSNTLSLIKHASFEKVLNLQIMLHLSQLIHRKSPILVQYLHEYGIFFNFDLVNLRKGRIEQRQFVFEVIYLYLFLVLVCLYFNHVGVEEA